MSLPHFKLYHYWRSSSSWRVRWALAIKNITVAYEHIGLLDGESESAEHLARNPLGFVPVLEEIKTGKHFTESTAIIEYLDEVYPTPSLIAGDPENRLHIRTLAQIINADIQPIQSISVLDRISQEAEARKLWARYWIERGFSAYEICVKSSAGQFSVGDSLSLADLCLIPQCYNAERFGVHLERYPTVYRIYQNALKTETAQASHPDLFKPADKPPQPS